MDTRKKYRLPCGYETYTPLFKHQLVGVLRCIRETYNGIFDEPGLGKTLQALYAAHSLRRKGLIGSTVVICPRSLVEVWTSELRKSLPGSKVLTLAGKEKEERIWFSGCEFYIINYELLGRTDAVYKKGIWNFKGFDLENAAKFIKGNNSMLVLDESHRIKNGSAKTTKACWALGSLASRRYCLTGTPEAEKPEDIWAQIYFLDGGNTLGTSFRSFCDRHVISRVAPASWGGYRRIILGYKNLHEVHAKVKAISLRRTKSQCLDLPDKLYNTRYAYAYGAQKDLLMDIRERLLQIIKNTDGDVIRMMTKGSPVSQLLIDLNRVAAMPCVVDPSIMDSAKLSALRESLMDNPGQRVVWVVNRNIAEAVSDGVKGSVCVHGGFSQEVRIETVERWKRGDSRVLVATLGSMSEGHTLTQASMATYMQLDYKLTTWEQSQDRLHRIGACVPVTLETLILDYSLDRYLRARVRWKASHVNTAKGGAGAVIDKATLKKALGWA